MVFQSYALYPHMTRAQEHRLRAEDGRAMSQAEIDAEGGEARPRSSTSPTTSTAGPASSPAASASASPSAAPSCASPRSSCSTSRCRTSTPRCACNMRVEIAELHQQLETTMIYVTHDQVEAMTMADKIVVLNAGSIEQVGTPLELYDKPGNLFVAGFIGSPKMNLIGGAQAAQTQGRDHRRPPRAYRPLPGTRRVARARSASPSISAPTPSCMSTREHRHVDGAGRRRRRSVPWRSGLPDA